MTAVYLQLAAYACATTFSPGPNNILLFSSTSRYGIRKGWPLIFGIWAGLITVMLLCGFGCAWLGELVPQIVPVAKYVGAAYLIWIGLQALRCGPATRAAVVRVAPQTDAAAPAPRLSARQRLHFFRQGFLTNALNPKAVLIFLTFLPQFMDPHASLAPQFLLLGGILSGLCLLWYVPLAYMLGRVRRVFENSRFQLWLQRCTGFVFIAFGCKLAAAQSR